MKKWFSLFFYIVSILIITLYICLDLSSSFYFSTIGRLVLLIGGCLFLYLGGLLMAKHINNNKPMIINLYIYLFLYLILFITLTLFDPMWNRHGISIFNLSIDGFKKYINSSFNIIPFKTIFEYVKLIFEGINFRVAFINLVGNLVCLMPLGILVPLTKKISTKKFLCISIIFVFIIEMLQLATMSGSCDIDDIILNVFGAFIAFRIINNKNINNLFKNIFLLEKNKLDKKAILRSISIFLILVVVVWAIYLFVMMNNNINYDKQHSFAIGIVDETENCNEALEMFYEDRYHKYYFSCIKSDNVYAIINDEKYLVKDLLNNNPTSYVININKLRNAGLDFITEDKYPSFSVKYNDCSSLEFKVDDEDLIEIENFSSIIYDNSYEDNFYVIPKKNGKTKLRVIYDNVYLDYVVIIDNMQATLVLDDK